ncbi:MAG: FadR/GntR family transcriptional regulator [Micromonosporaceae bacterium]
MTRANAYAAAVGGANLVTVGGADVAAVGALPRARRERGDGVRELVEVWRLLEPPLAALAAARISAEEIAELYRLCEDTARATCPEELAHHDVEFHRRIAAAAGNSLLVWLLRGLGRSLVSPRVWRGGMWDAVERTVSEHRSIVDALASGNAELAHCWSTVHIAGLEDRLRPTA